MNLTTVAALTISFLIAIFGGGILSRSLNNKIFRYKVLDTAIITLVLTIVIGRILGLALNWENQVFAGWNLLPVVEEQGGLVWFSQWPWLIFNITDGQFLFLEFLTAMSLAFLVANISHKRITDDKQREVYNRISAFLSILTTLPLAIVSLINSYHGNLNFLLPVFNISAATITLIAIFLFIKRAWQINLLILLVQIAAVIFINFEKQLPGSVSNQFSINITIPTIIYIALIIFTILQIVTRLNNRPKLSKENRRRDETTRNQNF